MASPVRRSELRVTAPRSRSLHGDPPRKEAVERLILCNRLRSAPAHDCRVLVATVIALALIGEIQRDLTCHCVSVLVIVGIGWARVGNRLLDNQSILVDDAANACDLQGCRIVRVLKRSAEQDEKWSVNPHGSLHSTNGDRHGVAVVVACATVEHAY